MVEIGKPDMYGHGRLDMISFTQNRAFLGVDIRHIQSGKPKIISQMLRECATYFEETKIRPIPTYINSSATEFTVSMPKNGELSYLPTVNSRQNSPGLQPDAAYLLVGGLGGVGRSMATWLVANGARNLMFLDVLGANVQVIKGSVAKKEDVETVVAGSKIPIRGVIQLSMVLRDRAVDNMTEEDWYTAIRPKVDGTWNLHNALLRAPLDFFVMFTSTSGIPTMQPPTGFLDAIVQYRHGLGLAASVIDLGVMEDVGFMAESANLLVYFRFLDANLLTEEDMRESVALAIARSFPCLTAKGEADSAQLAGSCTSYSNPSQIFIRVRSGIPLSDPSNRVVWKRDRRFAGYRSNMEWGDDDTRRGADENLKSFVTQLLSRGGEASGTVECEAIHFLATEMGKTLYGFMMKEAEDMPLEKPLASLGLDSLVAIELRNWCRTQIGLDVSVLEILQSTLKGLAEKAHTFLVGKQA
ncbi:KR domain containing protein [Rhypophila sp. PSN 637]